MRYLTVAFLLLACGIARAQTIPSSPTAEFGTPYEIRILNDGEVIEISGSFSWAVPQNLSVVLTRVPNLKTVWLDSPGGLVLAALRVKDMIRARGAGTHVQKLCASACTLAFLGGTERTIAPGARLGFHQASAPNVRPAQLDPVMRRAYQLSDVPAPFIDHVLATPPQSLWVPSMAELASAGILAGGVSKNTR
jgi:hypothetical protein